MTLDKWDIDNHPFHTSSYIQGLVRHCFTCIHALKVKAPFVDMYTVVHRNALELASHYIIIHTVTSTGNAGVQLPL